MNVVSHARDELVADCQLRAATDLLAHTWDPVLLATLRAGPLRRRELRITVGGLSDKVLTEALHRLVSNGLIRRRATRQAPPRVDYALTPLGESLVDGPLRSLGTWIIENSDQLLSVQEDQAREQTQA
jgi:DNA-binding HxlR family transcriptional regulator